MFLLQGKSEDEGTYQELYSKGTDFTKLLTSGEEKEVGDTDHTMKLNTRYSSVQVLNVLAGRLE